MSLATKPTFDAATVVALKMLNDTRRMEIRFVDDTGIEQVVSLPVQAALELARLTLDASAFLERLKEGPAPAQRSPNPSAGQPGFASPPPSQG